MPTIAENLGAYAATLKYGDLPLEVIHQAKRMMVDTLGCAIGAYDSEPSRIARVLAGRVSSSQPATVIGSGQKTSLDLAVFANDVMVRYLDFNDGYISKGGGHPSDSIAALLGTAEVNHAHGRELIVAIVLAYEIYCRFVDALDFRAFGVDQVTILGIGIVAGVARLLGLTQQQIVEAINIMVAGNVALNQTRVGVISKYKACAPANASRNAIFAAQLAAEGMTGPTPIFEGHYGFLNILDRQPLLLAPFGGEGRPFRIMQCHQKQFPLGNFSQSVVTAVLDVRPSLPDIRDIAEVHVRVSQKALDVMAGPEKRRPRNRETADHSMPYTAAVALMYGTIDESYFEERHFLHNAELLELADRIQCTASEEANLRVEEFNLCELDVVLHSGERKSVRVEYHRGDWRNPMSDAEIDKKFSSLARHALTQDRVDALLKELWKLENSTEVRTLIQMTKADA